MLFRIKYSTRKKITMKKREEIEMKFYEKLGVKKFIKFDNKFWSGWDRLTLALTPKSKKLAKQNKIKENNNYYLSRKIEGVIECQTRKKESAKLAVALAALYTLIGLFHVYFQPSLILSVACFSWTAVFIASATTSRYATLKAKKIEEKWHCKYESQKEDVIANIMIKNKELGRPRCEIIANNNDLKQTSFHKLISNAELSELKKYDNYLNSYQKAYENGETLPTLEYDRAKNKTLRLVPSYTKLHK